MIFASKKDSDLLVGAFRITGRNSDQSGSDQSHLVDLIRIAATGQVVDGSIQPLQDGTVSLIATQTLCDLVADVAGIDIGEDEGVGIAGNLAAGSLQLANLGGTAASNCSSPSTFRSEQVP